MNVSTLLFFLSISFSSYCCFLLISMVVITFCIWLIYAIFTSGCSEIRDNSLQKSQMDPIAGVIVRSLVKKITHWKLREFYSLVWNSCSKNNWLFHKFDQWDNLSLYSSHIFPLSFSLGSVAYFTVLFYCGLPLPISLLSYFSLFYILALV